MKRAITIGIIALMAITLFVFSTGCQSTTDTNVTVEPKVEINPITGEPYHDIVDKRGVTTNITEFNELLVRASKIQSYKYNLTDTGIGIENQKFFVLSRWVKIQFPKVYYHRNGAEFDEVIMDRKTKTALSHCSRYLCPKPDIDSELEKVRFDDYYVNDPLEYLYKFTNPEFLEEDMIGNDYVKVFSGTFEGNEARVWIQEYYGYPIKIVVKNADGSKRTIQFDDMLIDSTRSGEVDTPTNFTVSGEEGNWLFFKHYLGEWPEEGQKIPVQSGTTPFSV